MLNVKAQLVDKVKLKSDIFKFTISSKEVVEVALPGQFLNVKCSNQLEPFLRRPISISNIDKNNQTLDFIFQIKGKGTKTLAEKEVGDFIDIVGPLGNGTFSIKNYKNVAIIGGGIGIFPLYELAKQLKVKSNITTYLGFRNKDMVIMEDDFNKVSNTLNISTDDGSYAQKGFSVKFLKEDVEKNDFDIIFACGPMGMLKEVKKIAQEKNIPCQISLEEKMACGIGACLGCAVKLKEEVCQNTYGHICKTGPVFWASDVEM